MRIEYEKLFATPDELANFLCKSNREQDRIIAELLAMDIGARVEMHCQIPRSRDKERA